MLPKVSLQCYMWLSIGIEYYSIGFTQTLTLQSLWSLPQVRPIPQQASQNYTSHFIISSCYEDDLMKKKQYAHRMESSSLYSHDSPDVEGCGYGGRSGSRDKPCAKYVLFYYRHFIFHCLGWWLYYCCNFNNIILS